MEETTGKGVLDLEAIGARYEERGLGARLWSMARGLGRPHDTREYKEARIELQRLAAPLVAVVSVSLLVAVLCVVTAVQAQRREIIDITIPSPDDDKIEILETPEDPEPIDPTKDVSEVVIEIDTPSAESCQLPVPPAPNAGGAPAPVSLTSSPVSMFIDSPVKMRGLGMGDGGGFGSEVGGGSGGGQDLTGCLIGTIIDFKRNAEGKKRAEYSANGSYWKDLRGVVEAGFSAESLSKFFVPGKRVALTHMWIPPQSAANGPKSFGVEKVMEPSGFAVYYKGELKSAKRTKVRLWGYFDDCILAKANGKVVLDAVWNSGGLTKSPVTGWKTSDRAAVGKVKCPQRGGKMAPGDWFEVGPRSPVGIELVVGERPGGWLGGLVLVEEEGVKYPKDKDGSMVLPIFATRPLANTTKLDLARAEGDGNVRYEMGVDSPRFNASALPEEEEPAPSDDIAVAVNL